MNIFPISNHTRGTRGAFIEYTKGLPGLMLPFQFNPVQLQRNRNLTYDNPGQQDTQLKGITESQNNQHACSANRNALKEKLRQEPNLKELQKIQKVNIQEESISLDIRLDATDKLNEGDLIAEQFGIAPQLAILEQMITPEDQTMRAELRELISKKTNLYSYSKASNPPLILFVWGKRWNLPVNINSMNITESEFNHSLYPIRATVAVQLTVIEGANPLFKSVQRSREALAVAGMASGLVNVADITIPG